MLKSRRLIHWRRKRGGEPYASAWPPLRGKKKTPGQQAWVDHFKFLASAPKLADACALDASTELAKDTGYFYRDVISSALTGKLLYYKGSQITDPPLPRVYSDQVTKTYEGAPRVTTPTSSIYSDAYTPCAVDTWVDAIANHARWDNNAFWSATTHPERLTARSSGVYLVIANLETQVAGEYGYASRIIGSDGTIWAREDWATRTAPTQQPANNMSALVYLNAGDYLTVQANFSGPGNGVMINHFALVGITPESII